MKSSTNAAGFPLRRAAKSYDSAPSFAWPTSLTRTSDPSGLARTTMSSNCAGVCSRPCAVIGIVISVPTGAGSRPSRPAGFVVFCSRTAEATSPTVTRSLDMRAGSSCSSIENCRLGNVCALPMPGTRLSSSSR